MRDVTGDCIAALEASLARLREIPDNDNLELIGELQETIEEIRFELGVDAQSERPRTAAERIKQIRKNR